MAKATGANTKVFYSAESVIGTTDANAVFKELPFSSSTLDVTTEEVEDERLGGRDVECYTQGNTSVAGDLESFLSYGDFDDLIEAVFCGTWNADTPVIGTDELRNGAVRRGFTIAEQYNDFSPTGYQYYRGCEINTMSISMTPGQNVSVKFGVVGVDSPESYTQIAGTTYPDSDADCPFASFRASIEVDGQELAIVTQLDTQIENGIEGSYVVGSKFVSANKGIGKFRATGTLTVEFIDFSLYQVYRQNTSIDMVYTFVNKDGSELKIRQPNTRISSASKPISGEGDIILTGDLRMLKDATEGATLIATRTPA